MDQDKRVIAETSNKNPEPITFFEKNADFVYGFKKTEKLASAVYMVTNLFPENEPMRWSLRKKVSELLSFVITYKDTPRSAHANFLQIIKTQILEIVSLLEIGERGGLISAMNSSILREEFSNLVEVFETSVGAGRESFQSQIPQTFFDVARKESYIKDNNNLGSYSQSDTNIRSIKSPSNDIKDKDIITDKGLFKRSNRQNIILNLLKKKKEVTIKDIAQVIKDCSEKTIQRELISFIQAGVLKKTGERRWSKYSLA
jgi:hypothetical protein